MTLKLYHGIVSKTHERSEQRALQRRKHRPIWDNVLQLGCFSTKANVLENVRYCRVNSVVSRSLFVHCHRPVIPALKENVEHESENRTYTSTPMGSRRRRPTG
jgi:hypothetical protein